MCGHIQANLLASDNSNWSYTSKCNVPIVFYDFLQKVPNQNFIILTILKVQTLQTLCLFLICIINSPASPTYRKINLVRYLLT